MSSMEQLEREREVWTPYDVAQFFRVTPKTVSRWARTGIIPPIAVFRTLGGHRRFYADMIRPLQVPRND